MSRVSAFSSPFLVGFDEVERALERLSKASADGYPPYDIQRLESDGNGTILRITLAVAGFSEDDLDVTLEENELVVRGCKTDEPERIFLHRGIAARQFQRTFVLAEGIEVLGATLAEGLLSIDLCRPPNQRMVRRIKVDRRGRRGNSD
jgi:HSP20 family molecular chaperone IbpA